MRGLRCLEEARLLDLTLIVMSKGGTEILKELESCGTAAWKVPLGPRVNRAGQQREAQPGLGSLAVQGAPFSGVFVWEGIPAGA